MEYNSFENIPYFNECSAALSSVDFKLVELQVVPQNGKVKVSAVIASSDPQKVIGVSDCAKAHKVLFPVVVNILGRNEDDIFMEMCSPGIERTLKNAAEFEIFKGRDVRVWDKNINDWVRGVIKSSSENQVTLQVEGDGEKSIAYSDIAKAKFINL